MPNIFYLDYENGDDANDGSDWANAWKTFTLGATAARIAPGDIIRIAKSPAPSSIGNATWTSLSKIVTLEVAQTLNIDMCELIWTAGESAVATNSTYEKEGTNCMKITPPASPTINTLQAYHAIDELDLSSYQKISFWIRNYSKIIANNWKVCLCSDVAGETIVDTFEIPAIPSTNKYIPLTLAKVGGGNLGASIKSIALYSGSDITGMASKYIYVDNFIACTTAGLNLQSLISKNSTEQGGTEGWFGIQSIDGVTINLDNGVETKAGAGQGYYTAGTTPDTVTTYKRETIKTTMEGTSSNQVHVITDSGSAGLNIQYQGGYNILTTEQDGETFFDGLNGNGYAIYISGKNYITINRINAVRYSVNLHLLNNANYNTIDNVFVSNSSMWSIYLKGIKNLTLNNVICINNGNMGIGIDDCNNFEIDTIKVDNNEVDGIEIKNCENIGIQEITSASNNISSGVVFYTSRNCIINEVVNADSNDYGIEYTSNTKNNKIWSLSTKGNGDGGVYVGSTEENNMIANALLAEGTEIAQGLLAGFDRRFYSMFHDQGSNHKIFTDGGIIVSEATDRVGGTGLMWKLSPLLARDNWYPLTLSIAKIAVVADKLVTVKVWMKKNHATNIGGKLVCRGAQLAGIGLDDVVDTKANDADTWEELEISFTPTQAGVVEIEAWAYYVAGNADVYVEDMTITQAD